MQRLRRKRCCRNQTIKYIVGCEHVPFWEIIEDAVKLVGLFSFLQVLY